ncbi:heterocyst frequency control protein PatD [Pleurocapsa sp. FMAR1]|uniref:heterocyst frequency control protein PatD n=1 Tax=Pleurocapsa sp. FMAR1 TaxID=3040204 RepID=UPI0029C896F2|nr:heterocyst frequency control protein PatD [Pleurocapsa sp. FMAR1]
MLPASHNRAYQDFSNLLTKFSGFLINSEEQVDQLQLKQKFQHLQSWFDGNIADLESDNLEQDVISRWQSVQTEIKREFKLLATDILFLTSARQSSTLDKRLRSIKGRVAKLLSYCQIMNS